MRDPETGNSRGFGFISYDSFETSDAAIEVLLSECESKIVIVIANLLGPWTWASKSVCEVMKMPHNSIAHFSFRKYIHKV